ncbi:hypothetical protein [Tenacibaculum finnmarkense]|uniref:Type VI secretion system baseplate subunit TssK n=1 Tax=Tenacibaculum finnmarkense genomovar finnmarkense TaxID=1458503 RepID=A0AAP1WH83_9FLAO|nr:hypothetical protein [Tenacibaculum finnmarkense]MBE7653838.1 hypothetical protein [Tenacibaculum finnmarkense genomovar finnmarkense]MBE7696142.1 hypothetical protein [Tenacibaculum finnmarkense genomovar finnmarkense]MCD8428321.1 hypothetical protein [Tenacibaculum finnmarkense genomovar finnmarkense]MCD8455123.1 hypothetical protein [Tenacibaculum finnmarkense genomovar ulcerans]MCG8732092.1 hypothetical protein [Tenacibaculum finnmarkense]
MKNKDYYPVNWTDGVKLTKDHFIDNYFNTINSINDSVKTRMHTYDYGLLQAINGAVSALEIEVKTHTEERLVLALHSCNALTKSGYKIAFSAEMYGGDIPTAKIESKDVDTNSNVEFYVMVAINPFELLPVGEPDPEVIPLHHPYVLPRIGLKIMPKNQFNSNFMDANFLLVSKVYWRNGNFVVDKEYTPPVSRIVYYKPLHDFHKKIAQVLVRLRNYSVIINKKNRDKQQSNTLVRNTFLLSNKAMDFVGQHIFEFNQIGEEQPPVYIAQKISILANYLSNELTIMEETEKEKLLQYYYEWIDVKPSVFEATLGEVIDMNYNHHEINNTLDKVDYFMAIMDRLWKKLSDLEYIGQRKDNIVISEESMSIKAKPQNKSWSIID